MSGQNLALNGYARRASHLLHIQADLCWSPELLSSIISNRGFFRRETGTETLLNR